MPEIPLIIAVAFTAEEIGGYGSQHFATTVDPDKVVAMFNIEMIGKASKFGENSAFITGFERSDFGTILQKNLEGTAFKNFIQTHTPNKTSFTAATTPRWLGVASPRAYHFNRPD